MQYCTVKIKDLVPASYNPRKIDAESLKYLRESLDKLGDLIPIIVNKENNVIIAGHQRTKAMTANGTENVNVFYVSGVNQSDEIIFNQMHNYQDVDSQCEGYINDSELEYGFQEVDYKRFNIVKSNRIIEKEINRIISKYGNVLTAVCCNGEVIIGNNYVDCCVLSKQNPNVYILPPEKYELAKYYLLKRYGRFSYDGLKKESYVQGLAQPKRKINEDGSFANKSILYSTFVFPNLENIKGKRVLDFGAGRMVFARKLAEFVDTTAVEFFPMNYKSVDIPLGNSLIDYFIKKLGDGLFDYVINEYVINSVDCKEAEDSVMGCLNAFCKMGGTLYFGTRILCKRDTSEEYNGRFTDINDSRYFDENLFSATFREGQWYYQHFHTKESFFKLLEENGFKILEYENIGKINGQAIAVKVKELPKERKIKSIAYEFNLPLPNNRSYNRHQEVIDTMEKKNLF